MAQLRQEYNEFANKNTKIIILGPEDAKSFGNYFKSHNLPFIGLPDPRGSVLKLYGQEIHLFKLGRMPAQIIVDKNGFARFVHYGHNMADIPSNSELLQLIEQLEKRSTT